MNHPTDETLVKHALDLLEGAEDAEVREHLRSCESCRDSLRRIESEQRIFADFSPELPAARYPLPSMQPRAERWWLKAAAILLLGFAAGFGTSSLLQPKCVNVIPYRASYRPPAATSKIPVMCESVTLTVTGR